MRKIIMAATAAFLMLSTFISGANGNLTGPDETPKVVTEWEFHNEAPVGTTKVDTTEAWLDDPWKDEVRRPSKSVWYYLQPEGYLWTKVVWDYKAGCDCWRSEHRSRDHIIDLKPTN